MGRVAALAGGVGAARLLMGLVRVVRPEDVVVVGNVGDDFEFHGLHVCPDLDIVMYSLAGIVEGEKGYGVAGDTYTCLDMLGKLGFEGWFRLGDKDVAVQMVRTDMLNSGVSLSEAVAELCRLLGVKVKLMPVTNDALRTVIVSGCERLGFQEYFVKRGARDDVSDVVFEGCDHAKPAPGVVDAILSAESVIICPSNPVLSVNPILSVPGVRDALKRTAAKVMGVSPLVGGKAVKGPADRIMTSLKLEASAYGVAEMYGDFLDHMIIDRVDEELKSRIEQLGMKVSVMNTVMRNIEVSVSLARAVMNAE